MERFLTAQEGAYERALQELRAGRKLTHWMWFVFPQVAGLGTSAMAQKYAIGSRAEAAAYLAHPILGSRLVACAEALLSVTGRTAHEIMGSPDDTKLRSSMTLFATIADPGLPFHAVLDRYYAGRTDERTVEFLERPSR
ncbi:MAG TPA: DUF1810 domain-containing protein [Lacunisphaera sp.]